MKVKAFFSKLLNLYKGIIILLIMLMFIIVGTNVFSRYVLNNSLGWADELSRFIFIWISFLGAVLAYLENEHVGLNFVVEKMPSIHIKNIINLISDLLVLFVVVFLCYYGWIVANSATNVSPALYIPMKTVYMVVPFSALLMVIISIQKLFNHFKILVNGERIENTTENKGGVV